MNTLPVRYRSAPVAVHVHAPQLRTLRDVAELYFANVGDKENPVAFETKHRNVMDFLSAHGHLLIQDAKRFHLLLWVQGHEGWKSEWTKRRAVAEVRAVYGWAYRMGFLDKNPFAGTCMPRGKRRRPMTDAEFQSLLCHSPATFRRLLVFLKYSGCRPDEAAKAEWKHYDARRACIMLPEHKTAKTGDVRQVVLNPVLLKLLDWIRRHRLHPKYILTNKIGGRWWKSAIYSQVRRVREQCNIPHDCVPYGLRHRFCSELVIGGVDIATVATLAGHRDITTTQWYLHLNGRTDHLQDALKKGFGTPPDAGEKGGQP